MHASTSGFYAGVAGALDGDQMRVNNSSSEGFRSPITGQDGGVMLGYEWQKDNPGVWNGLFALEASGNINNARYKETNVRATQLRTYRLKKDYGASVLFGLSKGMQRLFARLGRRSTEVEHHEVATANKRSPDFSKYPKGFLVGLGLENFINDHWSLRAELDYSRYKRIANASSNISYRQHLQRTQGVFALLWHANAPRSMRAVKHVFKNGWHIGGSLAADRMDAHLRAVDTDDDRKRAHAMHGQLLSVALGRDWRANQTLGFGVELSAAYSNANTGAQGSDSDIYRYAHDADVVLAFQPAWHRPSSNLSAFVELGVATSHIKKTGVVDITNLIPPNDEQWHPAYVVGIGAKIMVDAYNAIGVRHRYMRTRRHRQWDGGASYKTAFRGQTFIMQWSHYFA